MLTLAIELTFWNLCYFLRPNFSQDYGLALKLRVQVRSFRARNNNLIMKKPKYQVKSKVWIYPGISGWHFVNIPKKQSKEIKNLFGEMAGGWGSLPVIVTIKKTSWKTSIFPDKKSNTYLLPLKSEVREKEKILSGNIINFEIEIQI